MSEPPEDHEQPMDADAAMVDEEGQWRNVPRPTTEELLTPSTQVVDPPSIPIAVKVIGIAIVLVLLMLSLWLGLSLGRSGTSSPATTPTVEGPRCLLEPPTQVGSLVRGDVNATPSASEGERNFVTTTYTDGTDKIVLLLSCPEDDLSTYFEGAFVTDAEPVEGSNGVSCGTADNGIPLCARVVDDTVIAVAGLTEQDFPTLISLVNSFQEELQ